MDKIFERTSIQHLNSLLRKELGEDGYFALLIYLFPSRFQRDLGAFNQARAILRTKIESKGLLAIQVFTGELPGNPSGYNQQSAAKILESVVGKESTQAILQLISRLPSPVE